MSWQPVYNWGWQAQWGGTVGYITYQALITQNCYDQFGHITGNVVRYQKWVYHDTWGIAHSFSGEYVIYNGSCSGTDITSFTSTTSDGSGLTLNAGAPSGTNVKTPGGAIYYPPINPPGSSTQSTTLTDANGNQITSNSSGVFTDTLGTTALTVSGSAPNPTTFSYTPPNAANGPASFVMHYTNKTVKTNFGCSGISEYGPTTVPLVTDITLPDGSQYTFTYEDTPGFTGDFTGRLKSVTLPTGGTITYTYTGGTYGINCSDGSAATLTRVVNPGGQWTYQRAQVSGNHWKTTITDPSSNTNVIHFQKDSATTNPSNNFYETQRETYQGSINGTLLATLVTCYNSNLTACDTTAVASRCPSHCLPATA